MLGSVVKKGGGGADYTAGTGIDISNNTISLKTASENQLGGVKIDGDTVSVDNNGVLFQMLTQTITLSDITANVTVGSTTTVTASTDGGGTLTVSSSDTDVATATISNGTITITGVGEGTAVITVNASASGQYGSATKQLGVVVSPPIYGVSWDGTSTTAWTRTDSAANFEDPNPYYSGMTGTPSSPFDNIMPWSGMRIVEDSNAGTLVEIPKFYYKLQQNTEGTPSSGMKIQIAMNQHEGFVCSPAHMDRGDGVGERDYVYVGRYHCWSNNSSNYKSVTGQSPTVSVSRYDFRRFIHNRSRGEDIWQHDFAMRFTIWLLYLVEFADWNSQAKIGYGCGNDSSIQAMGYTDNMGYHTGTTQSNRTTYGCGTQYRYIEGLWDNVFDWLDGCCYYGSGLKIILNPNNFGDISKGTFIETPSSGYPSIFTIKNIEGTFPMLVPTSSSGNASTYSCDQWLYTTNYVSMYIGGYYAQAAGLGMFSIGVLNSDSATWQVAGSRLMVLPPSRLSPPT